MILFDTRPKKRGPMEFRGSGPLLDQTIKQLEAQGYLPGRRPGFRRYTTTSTAAGLVLVHWKEKQKP